MKQHTLPIIIELEASRCAYNNRRKTMQRNDKIPTLENCKRLSSDIRKRVLLGWVGGGGR